MLLAKLEDLADWRGEAFASDDEERRASRVLELASSAVASYARNRFLLTEDDVAVVRAGADGSLFLPQVPVLEVTALSLEDQALAGPWRLVDGKVYPLEAGLGFGSGTFSVTYTHGYVLEAADVPDPNPLGVAVLPDEVQAVVLAVAARSLLNPQSLSQESLGSVWQGSYREGGLDLTQAEQRILNPWRRPWGSL